MINFLMSKLAIVLENIVVLRPDCGRNLLCDGL